MKLKNLFLGSFALTAMLFAQSCEDKNDGPTGAPSIELSTQTLDFEKDGGSQTIKLTATRDWNVTNVPDWIAVDPKSGNPAENKEVTVTVLENTGMDRSQEIKFTIGFDGKTLTVNQKGTGSASEMIVYHNDFDKELAVKDNSGWKTYLALLTVGRMRPVQVYRLWSMLSAECLPELIPLVHPTANILTTRAPERTISGLQKIIISM